MALPSPNIVLGKNTHTDKDITITEEERLRSISVVGATGTGKSTLLRNMALQAVKKHESLIYIDVDDRSISDLLVRIPQERTKDVIYLDFSVDTSEDIQPADRFIGINHLAGKTRREVERYVELFKRLWNIGKETPNLELTLRASLLTLWYNKATLTEMPDLLRDKEFRSRCIAHIPNTPDAHFVRWFWKQDLLLHDIREQLRLSDSTLNKGLQLLIDPSTFYIVSQEATTLHFADIIENNKILLIRLSKLILGDETVRRIGAMILEEIKHALFSRADLPNLDIVTLICDEWQLYLTPDFFEDVLSQGRRYGISTILATQTLENFDNKLQAILDQVGTHITFAVGIKDANKLAPFYAKDPPVEPRYEHIYEAELFHYTKEVVTWSPPEAEQQYNQVVQELTALEQREYCEELKIGILRYLLKDIHFSVDRPLVDTADLSYRIGLLCHPEIEDIHLPSCQKVIPSRPQQSEDWVSKAYSLAEQDADLCLRKHNTEVALNADREAMENAEFLKFGKALFCLSLLCCFFLIMSFGWQAGWLFWSMCLLLLLLLVWYIIQSLRSSHYKTLVKRKEKELAVLERERDQYSKERYNAVKKATEVATSVFYIVPPSVLSPLEKQLQSLLQNNDELLATIKGTFFPPREAYVTKDEDDPYAKENFFDQFADIIPYSLRRFTHPPELKEYEVRFVPQVIPLTAHEKKEVIRYIQSLRFILSRLLNNNQRECTFVHRIGEAISVLNPSDRPYGEYLRNGKTMTVVSLEEIEESYSLYDYDNYPRNRQIYSASESEYHTDKGLQRYVMAEGLYNNQRGKLAATHIYSPSHKGYWHVTRFPDIVSFMIIENENLRFDVLKKQEMVQRKKATLEKQRDELLTHRTVTQVPVTEYKSIILNTGEVVSPYYKQKTETQLRVSIGFSEGDSMGTTSRGRPMSRHSSGQSISISEKDIPLFRGVPGATRPFTDMEKEKAKELLGLPDGIAYVAMRMRGDRFKPRMKTYNLDEKYPICGSLGKRRLQALENAIPYTTEAQKIDEAFWKRRQRFGVAPSPVMQPPQEERQTFQEERSIDTPVPVTHATRRTKQFALSVTPQFDLPHTASEENLLRLLYLFGYLDIENIARLVKVEKHNINNLRSKSVKPLVTAGLVEEHNKPLKEASRGMPPRVYSLSSKGRETLGKMRGFTPSKAKAELGTHLVNLNDLLVSAVLLPTVEPHITLAYFEHEYALKQRPIPIGNNKSVVPDGFVSYSLGEPYGVSGELVGICFEWDEGTESYIQLQDKFNAWITAANGAYQDRFGTDSLTIAFCCLDEGRVTQMVRLAEQVLAQNRSYAELFVFGAFAPAKIDPLTLLTTPLFKQPFDTTAHALIEKLHSVSVKKEDESKQRQAGLLHLVKEDVPRQQVPDVPQPQEQKAQKTRTASRFGQHRAFPPPSLVQEPQKGSIDPVTGAHIEAITEDGTQKLNQAQYAAWIRAKQTGTENKVSARLQPLQPAPTSNAQLEQPILSYEQHKKKELEQFGHKLYDQYKKALRLTPGATFLTFEQWKERELEKARQLDNE